MKMNMLYALAGILLISSAASAKNVSLVKNFNDREVIVDDGTHKITVRNEGHLPKVTVEESLATCKISVAPSASGKLAVITLEMIDSLNDDGFNGCVLTIHQPSGDEAIVTLGYFVEN